MNRRLDELMQSVLDGDATPEEASELERRLVADAAARARFAEFRRLFDGLREVPKAYPPEGLVASVLANIPQNTVSAGREDQPFVAPGVIRASSRKAREIPGTGIRVSQVFQRFARGRDMNEQKGGRGGLGNRKVWIGGGIAVAAAIVAIGTGLYPPSSGDTAGTIVPAQRYRAAQPTDLQGSSSAQGGGAQPAIQTGAGGTQGTLSGTQGTLSGTQGTLSGTQGTLSGTQGTLSGTQGTLSGTHGTLSGTQGTLSGTQGTLSGTQGTLSGTQGTRSGTQGTLSGTQGTLSGTQGTLSGTQGTLSGTQGTLSGTQGTLSGTQGTLSGTNGTLSVKN